MSHGFTIEHRDRACVVTMLTDLTAVLVADLRASLRGALAEGVAEVEVDLGRAGMLDSSGIGLLVATANTVGRTGGRVRVVNASKDIQALLQSMRLTSRLDVRGPQ